jgi:RNA polymerase sigma-70 factor (ECF subfamily)
MIPSDEHLLPIAIAGDESALTTLLERHGVKVRIALEKSYRHRLKGELDLDDVMQVTYLEAFLRIRDFVPGNPNAFQAWLKRIAENNVRDAIRKTDRVGAGRFFGSSASRNGSVGGGFDPEASAGTPSRVAGRDEALRLLEAALAQLPDDYERVIRLYDLEGLSGPEVARVMGRSHGAIKMLVARARDRLGELLGSGSKYFSGQA